MYKTNLLMVVDVSDEVAEHAAVENDEDTGDV